MLQSELFVKGCSFDVNPRPAAYEFVHIPGCRAKGLPWEPGEGTCVTFRRYGNDATTILKVKSPTCPKRVHGYISWLGLESDSLSRVVESGDKNLILHLVELQRDGVQSTKSLRIVCWSLNNREQLVAALRLYKLIHTNLEIDSESIACAHGGQGSACSVPAPQTSASAPDERTSLCLEVAASDAVSRGASASSSSSDLTCSEPGAKL
jgi:hypothetical protein